MKTVCPLKSFYCFEGKCPLKTCQNNTPVTERGCLSLDRKERHDKITDTELLYYKIKPNKEEFASKSLDSKFASYIRKRYIASAKGIMTLYLYVQFCKATQKPNKNFKYVPGSNPVFDDVINSAPLNIKLLGFETWMLYYLYNPKFLDHFIETQERKTSDVSIVTVLGTTPRRYDTVVEELKKCKNLEK